MAEMLKVTPTSPLNGGEPAVVPPPVVKAKAPRKPKAKKPKAPRKAKARRGGGKALTDFTNEAKVKVLKGKEIARKACFRSGQTVGQCLAAQKKAKYRGRRKYIRKQIRLGRISLSS